MGDINEFLNLLRSIFGFVVTQDQRDNPTEMLGVDNLHTCDTCQSARWFEIALNREIESDSGSLRPGISVYRSQCLGFKARMLKGT